jgi:thymidylate synthase ThyX
MPDSLTAKPPTTEKNGASSGPQVNVFAVHGVEPEVQAYAMAKYSRSALSMKESLKEISEQKAEQFLNTFYFQYGHRSIADLAHLAFAIEKLSILAAIILVDEQRWDGQERSTRYQNFQESGWFFPVFPGLGEDGGAGELYSTTIANLQQAYQQTTAAVLEVLRQRVPRPETMKPDAYERTLRARAFDCARYLLPLATNTSLGQIVSARTLETQVSRLLSHPAAEIRDLGARLRDAATGSAWNVNAAAAQGFVDKLERQGAREQGSEGALGQGAREQATPASKDRSPGAPAGSEGARERDSREQGSRGAREPRGLAAASGSGAFCGGEALGEEAVERCDRSRDCCAAARVARPRLRCGDRLSGSGTLGRDCASSRGPARDWRVSSTRMGCAVVVFGAHRDARGARD